MKIINAKGLVRFAATGGFPDKEGFLLKRGDVNKGFQRRWFVLRGNLLFYYEKRGDKEPAGVIILEGCTIEVADCEDAENYAFQIVFPGSAARTYILSTDCQEELESWMRVLSCAPYDYVKLLVGELENQLQEAKAVDHAKLVQAADRESKMFSRTYSRGSEDEKLHRLPPPATQVRKNPFGDIDGTLCDSVSRKNPFGDVDGSLRDSVNAQEKQSPFDNFHGCNTTDVYETFGNRSSCVSLSFSICTWQMLGISNFYEMHDEVRRQIREFSADLGKNQHTSMGTS